MRPPPGASIGRPCIDGGAAGMLRSQPMRGVPRRCRLARLSSPDPRSRCWRRRREPSRSTCCTSTTSTAASSSINAFESTCSAEDEAAGDCFGGAARLKTAIDAAREEIEGRRRQRAGAGRRRRVPGLAVLHHRAGAGRGRALERDGAGRDGLRQPRVRPRAGGAGEVHRDGGVPGAVGQRRRLGRQPAGAAGRGPSGARGRRREGGHPRRDHARHGGDLLARADRELRRAGRLSDRPGGGAGGRGGRQDHPPVASRGRRRHRGGRGGAGHRPDRRRARPRAVLERGRRAACLSADGRRSRRAPGADRAGGGLFEVPRADHGRVRRRRGRHLGDRRHHAARQGRDARPRRCWRGSRSWRRRSRS